MTFTLLGGKLLMNGPATAEDALWLAASAEARPGMSVLDAAAGTGVAGLALLTRCPDITVMGIEIQPELVAQAQANAALNGFKTYNGVAGDILTFNPGGKFDAVVCNPPFHPAERGHQSKRGDRQLARHQPEDLLGNWLKHLLALTTGPVYLVLHSASRDKLRRLAGDLALTVVVLPLATHATRPPKRMLVRMIAGGFGWTEKASLKSHDAPLRAAVLERGEPLTGCWTPYRGD
jgi:tRNA1(Val) A37 N6-methylase TrmN6